MVFGPRFRPCYLIFPFSLFVTSFRHPAIYALVKADRLHLPKIISTNGSSRTSNQLPIHQPTVSSIYIHPFSISTTHLRLHLDEARSSQVMSDLPGSLRTRQKSFLRSICTRQSYSRASSSPAYNEDAITPCPVESSHDDGHTPLSRSSSSSSLRSTRSLRSSIEDMRDYNDIDTQLLWRRMLAIHRTFGCYNSTRMNIAIEMGEQNASVRTYYYTLENPRTHEQI